MLNMQFVYIYKMKKYLLIIILSNVFAFCRAQEPGIDTAQFTIINNEKVITNEMIFYAPNLFPKNKKPLIMINGTEVPTLCCYNDHNDFKNITVLQPDEGLVKYGKKGKNGVIMLQLKDEVKEPAIEILTNAIYYKCKVNGQLVDTTKAYFDHVNGKDCSTLDLRSDSLLPNIYTGFDNVIKMKHLGFGWDLITVSMMGASIAGSGNTRIIRAAKEGDIRLTLNINGKIKIFMMKAVALPAAKSQ